MNDYLEAWDRRLRTAGFRITPQRQLVLEAVTNLRHATPEEILTEVQETASGVNLSTVKNSAPMATKNRIMPRSPWKASSKISTKC